MQCKIKFIVILLSWKCTMCTEVEKNTFPKDFLFGFATASYQIEGGWKDDGKGENVWDRFAHMHKERIVNHDNGDIACDSYHLYKEDVQMLKYLKAQVYRFSLSWSRILPDGSLSKINQAGVQYYKNLINELVANNIQPMVTLFHWDLPQPLQDLGGWTNPIMIDYFLDYAKLAFNEFGDKVKWWITFNEPLEVCKNGYGSSSVAPGINMSGVADYMCGHTILKSHAKAYHCYNEKYKNTQKGKIGISLNGGWNEPYSNSFKNENAAETSMEFEVGWFLHPILGPDGDYPQVMRKNIDANSKKENYPRSRLPRFSSFWKNHVKGTLDFLGVNHYSTYLARPLIEPFEVPSFKNDMGVYYSQNSSWPSSSVSWLKVEPTGLRKKVNWIRRYTNNFPVFITENGYADLGELNDVKRISYYKLYLKELLKAITYDHCNVIGYCAWSLMDNFEWELGYSVKFGIYHVNFTNSKRERREKSSVQFFKKLIETKSLENTLSNDVK